MTIKTWLEAAGHDADRRGLGVLRPLLEGLSRQTAALRAADWNLDVRAEFYPPAPDAR